MNPMLILDLKGDEAMFSCVRDEARRSKREFLFFTPEKGKASHRFNPFLSCLLYTSPSPRDGLLSRMPSSA